MRTFKAAAAAVVLFGSPAAHAAEIKVIASAAVKEVVRDLALVFEKASGHKVVTIWAGTEAITKRISGGESADVVIIAARNIDKLIAEGWLAAGSRLDIAKSGIGVAVRAGQPKPDISSGDAVKKAVLAARSVAYSSGPSGFYLADLFKKMGIADQIKDKVKQTPSGVQVGEVVARGEAELGFQQVSELLHLKGIEYLGPLPPDIQHVTVFSAGLHGKAAAPDAAKALIKFLASPEAAPVIRKTGMEPG
ncbi:MAG: molybdate ABC transporter substrate-binding protein [Candidatus Odyssella sp.]|nr:molybdate ABC transporter substrate-binding protein [Candidatus Odyssella sp.]